GVWDPVTGEPAGPPLQGSDITEVRFLPGGRRLLLQGGAARQAPEVTARVWDSVTGRPLTLPWKVDNRVGCKPEAFSPDGRLFVSGTGPLFCRAGRPIGRAHV